MSLRQKFLFDTAFDSPGAEGTAKPLPAHTDEDLQRARDEAFRAGREAALLEAREIEERRIKEIFATMAERIAALSGNRAADADANARQATEVAVAICRKVLPELARRNALTEIEGVISDCLAAMPEEPRIVVRVADQTVDRLQTRVSAYAAGFDGKLVLLGDDEMALTDCRVDWPDGGTERNLDRLWRDIDDAIARTLARGTPVTDGDEGAPDAATPPDAPADNPATTAH